MGHSLIRMLIMTSLCFGVYGEAGFATAGSIWVIAFAVESLGLTLDRLIRKLSTSEASDE